jgi:signal peptidase II
MRNLRWLWVAVLVIVLDYITKQYFSSTMQLWESISILPFLNWTLAHNYGAAFSFLHDAGGWQRWFFTAIALVVTVAMSIWMTRLPKQGANFLLIGIALVIGGALGNLYDRVTLGYVVDFVHFFYRDWHFPAFNIADCGISVGAAILIIDAIFFEKKREQAALGNHHE